MRARSLLIPLAVLALLVTGCTSDDPEPSPSPSSSAPSPSDDPTTPSPTESDTASAEGPKAFIRRWVQVKDQMITTGRTRAFTRLAADPCPFCESLVSRVRGVYADGGSVTSDGWRIKSISRAAGTAEAPEFSIEVHVQEATELDANGDVVETYPAGDVKYQVLLEHSLDGYKLVDVTQDAT